MARSTRYLTRMKSAMAETEAFDHELWCIEGSVVQAHRCASAVGKNRPV